MIPSVSGYVIASPPKASLADLLSWAEEQARGWEWVRLVASRWPDGSMRGSLLVREVRP